MWRRNGLDKSDIPELADGKKPSQILGICCWNNQLDYSAGCFGQIWLVDQKAISFLGASQPSYTDDNDEFDKYIWDSIINHGLTKAGTIFNWAVTRLHLNNPSEEAIHNIYLYLLLGDPTADFKGPE